MAEKAKAGEGTLPMIRAIDLRRLGAGLTDSRILPLALTAVLATSSMALAQQPAAAPAAPAPAKPAAKPPAAQTASAATGEAQP